MSKPLLIVVTLIYGYVFIDLLMKKQWPMAIAYFGWAVANVGIIWNLKAAL